MGEAWEDLAESIVNSVKERAGDVLEQNQGAKDFLWDRAKRLAKLTFMAKTEDGEVRQGFLCDMEVVRQAIDNEIATLSVIGSDEGKALFKEILSTAFTVFVKAVPSLLAL